MNAIRPLALMTVVLAAAACQPAGMAPTAPAGPSATTIATTSLPTFATPNADQLAFLRRRRGRDPLPAAGPAVIAAWDGPAEAGSGNWDYALTAGARALEAGGQITLTDSNAALEAAEVAAFPGEEPATTALRVARAWDPNAQALAPGATPAIHKYALTQARPTDLGQLLPAPVPSGTPAPGAMVYASLANGQVLSFWAAEGRIVALRETWAEPPQASEATITADAAKAAVLAAIADKDAKALEATTGADFFAGTPFKNADKLPVGCLELKPQEGQALRIQAELAATLADPVLERRCGKLVWRVRHDLPEHCNVGPTLETVYERDRKTAFIRVIGAGGYVDATTGQVIRFRRHYRVYGVAGS